MGFKKNGLIKQNCSNWSMESVFFFKLCVQGMLQSIFIIKHNYSKPLYMLFTSFTTQSITFCWYHMTWYTSSPNFKAHLLCCCNRYHLVLHQDAAMISQLLIIAASWLKKIKSRPLMLSLGNYSQNLKQKMTQKLFLLRSTMHDLLQIHRVTLP